MENGGIMSVFEQKLSDGQFVEPGEKTTFSIDQRQKAVRSDKIVLCRPQGENGSFWPVVEILF